MVRVVCCIYIYIRKLDFPGNMRDQNVNSIFAVANIRYL